MWQHTADSLLEIFLSAIACLHALHVWVFIGLSFSSTHVYFVAYLRHKLAELLALALKLRQYRRVMREINDSFAEASAQELSRHSDDRCAICLKPLLQVRACAT